MRTRTTHCSSRSRLLHGMINNWRRGLLFEILFAGFLWAFYCWDGFLNVIDWGVMQMDSNIVTGLHLVRFLGACPVNCQSKLLLGR